MALPAVAVAIGDPGGIGPEISLKAALDPAVRAMCRPILVGDRRVLEVHARACGLSLAGIELIERRQLEPQELRIGQIAAAHGRSALDSARAAIEAALAGEVSAVVAAPHNESAIHAAGVEFDGYPSFVARVAGLPPEDGILMLCFEYQGREVRIAHVTLHVAVGEALKLITRVRILRTIRAVNATLKNPRIAVSGVNPHAGEAGAFGREEIEIVAPAVARLRRSGLDVVGPAPADTLFHAAARRRYDAAICLYHDQALIPLKTIDFFRGVNVTLGLPVVRTSPDHGTALDLAGRGVAKPDSLIAALRLAATIAANRRAGNAQAESPRRARRA
jgi:4-hydroxythreonine-4-phosphate dehydrogenase